MPKHYPLSTAIPLPPTIWVERLLGWYAQHKRCLPWRDTKNPYRIWLSEVILQQTRVAQGLPYYHRFVTSYPTVVHLASASEEAVLRTWQGLGYYRRARLLHTCARHVVEHLDGTFPTTYRDLLKLPGIGPYTAAAIASIAYDEPVPAVDGNVYRVLTRLWGLHHDIASPKGQRAIYAHAYRLLPATHPGRYNEAIMEFGALQCTPSKPDCATCPLQPYCKAYREGTVSILPIKSKRTSIKKRFFHYFVFYDNKHIYLHRRSKEDIWARLYDFYLVEHKNASLPWYQLDDPLLNHCKSHHLALKGGEHLYKHQLTHQHIHARFWHAKVTPSFLQAAAPCLQKAVVAPYKKEKIDTLPKSRLLLRYLNDSEAVLFGKQIP